MKESLRQLLEIRGATTPAHGLNLVREYLQARILGVMQRQGAMLSLAFQGGTALRFLYAIPRHSEDLDFARERPEAAYDLRAYLEAVRGALHPEGYAVELKLSDRRTVHSAFVKFPGLLHELGLAQRAEQMLSIKIEVDTNPPRGAVLETTVVHRHVTLQLQHHDRASLFAGKLHAILQRPYVKGRDVYDLMWYLGQRDWPEPNLELLNAALAQSGWTGRRLGARTWRKPVGERIEAMRWERVVSDIAPFLEVSTELATLTRENMLRLLERR